MLASSNDDEDNYLE